MRLGPAHLGEADLARERMREGEGLLERRVASGIMSRAVSGYVALAHGDYEGAKRLFDESLARHRELANSMGVAESLAGLAGVAAAAARVAAPMKEQGEAERAARLFAASEALREASGGPQWPAERAEWNRYLSMAQAQLGEEIWQAAWQEGRAMSMKQAIEYALEGSGSGGSDQP